MSMYGTTRIVRLVSGQYAVQEYGSGWANVKKFDSLEEARQYRIEIFGNEVDKVIDE